MVALRVVMGMCGVWNKENVYVCFYKNRKVTICISNNIHICKKTFDHNNNIMYTFLHDRMKTIDLSNEMNVFVITYIFEDTYLK